MNRSLSRWMEHIRTLSEEIGPRGFTTDGERRGALYCKEIMESHGIKAQIEHYRGARSTYFVHLLAGLTMLMSWIIYP